jgi:hypothetical protein
MPQRVQQWEEEKIERRELVVEAKQQVLMFP